MLGIAAAAKIKTDIKKERAAKAEIKKQEKIAKHVQAQANAMNRMEQKVQSKFDQNQAFEKFKASLGDNKAPDMLKRIAFEEAERQKNTVVRIGGEKVDISKLSPEARTFLTGRNN